ncbi:hypothetical protein [Cyanobacterium sp. uoEpiScrs1]|uniref:hypothetical protein n=1 Tax=Cyanobacterium sp. uoEpiScrs1 TaxID=2976343 RepID=UPI002269C499|nr:hypothetical protein [Cyanobacterium sp. uoEpiScrs1]
MSWSTKSPFLSLSVVFSTYCLFGWNVGLSVSSLTHSLIQQGKTWGWLFESDTVFLILHVLAGVLVLIITTSLVAAPVALITIVFGSGFKSDNRAMVSVLWWTFAVVLMVCWLEYFIRLLLLLCAATLGKLELQDQGYPQWKVLLILMIICLGSFGFGLAVFHGYT